jgi:spermidine synthase
MSPRSSDRTLRSALFALFFLSGLAALIYQTAWQRLLGLFAGADTIATALVVGAFLLGLGIGSFVAGLWADGLSRRAALIGFAVCEIGIALFAVLSPWLYYDVIYRELLPLSSSRAVLFSIVFAGLLWPTFLMGCSLPLLSKAVVSQIAGSAQLIGWLYGLNTLGAACGAFAGGWLLIGSWGFDKALYFGACVNLVVAAGGLLLSRRAELSGLAPIPKHNSVSSGDRVAVASWSLLVFVSGFLIVALQIVWYRLIGLLLQSNSYSFSLVLTVFLLGDGSGLLVGARVIDRIADPRRFFFAMQGVAAALALAGVLFVYLGIGLGFVPGNFVDFDAEGGKQAHAGVIALVVAVVVLPASFIMGFSFPVVQKAVQNDIERLGSRVGLVQLANIVGNSAGSLLAGLVLLDLLGTAGTLRFLLAIGLSFAVLSIVASRPGCVTYATMALLAAGLVLFPAGEAFWRRLHGLTTEQAIVAEDRTGLSLLKMADADRGKLYIQGHAQSGLPFDTIHMFLGAIGPFTHAAPKRVLVIGLGIGGTPYAAGLHPSTERVRVVEIVAPVIAILRGYLGHGGQSGVDRILSDPKFEVVLGDGRHALALDADHYDVIEADAVRPKTALSGLLYSQEFMRQVQAKLAPGGIYVQWAPTERTIETFRSVFPHVALVHPALLGSDQPIPYDRETILELLARPDIDSQLKAARVDRGELRLWFEKTQIESLNMGQAVPAPAPNTDFFPRDEYYLNQSLTFTPPTGLGGSTGIK